MITYLLLRTALFLGSMGLLAYGISDQLILGYMIPRLYFAEYVYWQEVR